METTTEESESVTLAAWPRRNRETGAPEEIRITTGDYRGRQVTSIRTWFQGRTEGVWRPTKQGITIREHELDEAIEALQEARRLVMAESRSTSPTSKGKAGPPAWGRLHNRPASVAGNPPHTSRTTPPWETDFDEFSGGQ